MTNTTPAPHPIGPQNPQEPQANTPSDPLATSGLVLVDKPQGLTSHDVVARLRRLYRTRKVGHAGTLDPMATGVLVCGIDRGTKLLAHLVDHSKTYEATIRLGYSTTTDDADGDYTHGAGIPPTWDSLTPNGQNGILTDAITHLTGDILQRPSTYSALKVNGRRAYDLARSGTPVDLPARPVTVDSFTMHSWARATVDTPGGHLTVLDVDVTVSCSAGTYIRALARDLGQALDCGGHLTRLRRTRVGTFGIDGCHSLETLQALAEGAQSGRAPLTLTLDEALRSVWPVIAVSKEDAAKLSQGGRIPRRGQLGQFAAQGPNGHIVAVVEEKPEQVASIFVARPASLVN